MLVVAAETLPLLPHTRLSRTCLKHLTSFVCIIQEEHEQQKERRGSAGKYPLFCSSCRHQHRTNELLFVAAGYTCVPCYCGLLKRSTMANADWGLVEWTLSEDNRNDGMKTYPPCHFSYSKYLSHYHGTEDGSLPWETSDWARHSLETMQIKADFMQPSSFTWPIISLALDQHVRNKRVWPRPSQKLTVGFTHSKPYYSIAHYCCKATQATFVYPETDYL
jgi:hypothetical protein